MSCVLGDSPHNAAMRINFFHVALFFAPLWGSAPAFALPSDEAIQEILVQRVDKARQAVGIVVGIVEPGVRRIVAHGTLSATDPRPVDGDTVFEIGSVTKVFTSLLLADMVRRREASLDEPVADLLPSASVRLPQRGGRQITLVDLATHSSGLPRMPVDFKPGDFGNPYAELSVEQMYAYLSSQRLTRDIGSQFEYSNLGVGLLGHALALRARVDYETLLRQRITGPLGLRDTAITLTPMLSSRMAVGHSWALTPVDKWSSSTLAGAGFLHSTANDLLSFLEGFIGTRRSALTPAMKTMLQTRRDASLPSSNAVALGWLVSSTPRGDLIWHGGRTGGYTTFVGFDADARVGIVVLANATTRLGITDIGMHLLDPQRPVADPKPPRFDTRLALDPEAAERLVGRYEWAPQRTLHVTQEAGRLYLQAGTPRRFELFPNGSGEMYMKETPATVSFDEPASGRTRAVIVRLYGQEYRAWRVGER